MSHCRVTVRELESHCEKKGPAECSVYGPYRCSGMLNPALVVCLRTLVCPVFSRRMSTCRAASPGPTDASQVPPRMEISLQGSAIDPEELLKPDWQQIRHKIENLSR
ncbi:hypothetical protein HPB48_012521 [Haemaphysalis longicornis]|uniref:Uncharacterized protein n=1 Tax=Haemaphysalis longicornis TaxID=44386 RepID=A0A9J6G5L4_HAELO|nr:hypothetical protein HPB48_012521 [Haemaphysalis longicornis]